MLKILRKFLYLFTCSLVQRKLYHIDIILLVKKFDKIQDNIANTAKFSFD